MDIPELPKLKLRERFTNVLPLTKLIDWLAMKITFEADRIRWQSENAKESEALRAVHDLVCFRPGADEEIANDHGCKRGLNYCCTSLPMTCAESELSVVAHNATN